MNTKTWPYLVLLSLLACLPPLEAESQEVPLAPLEQIQARGGGNGGAGGEYSTSVPLDLPGERGGLPVPVALLYGGNAMGAAGLGWDVPISFLRENRSLAHRRPTAADIGKDPAVPLQIELSLLGSGMKMVPEGTGYVPQRGNLSIRAEKSGDTWRVYDGEGRTYTFTRPSADGHVLLADMWLLDKIEGMTSSSKVELVYEVASRNLGNGVGVSVDLVRVKYNHSSGGKAKHEIALNYGAVQSQPLSFDVDGGVVMRVRTLTGIDVLSREAVGDSDSQLKKLAHYKLTYQDDADTGLPRLKAVSVFGRDDTPQATEELPVASYEYGSATLPATPLAGVAGAPAAKLQFSGAISIARPSGAVTLGNGTSRLARTHFNEPNKDKQDTTEIELKDVTGDGRQDVVYRVSDGSYKVVSQVPGSSNGYPNFSGTPRTFGEGVLPVSEAGAGVQTIRSRTITYPDGGDSKLTTTDTWKELRDINGDGRVDYLVANELERKWVVYINQPNASDPKLTTWVRHEHDVSALIDALAASGNTIVGSWSEGKVHLPLRRVVTGMAEDNLTCQSLSGGTWVDLPHQYDSSCGMASSRVRYGEVSGTVWDLMDFNGDSAIDLVYSDAVIHKQYPSRYEDVSSNFRIRRSRYRTDSRPSESAYSYSHVIFGRYTDNLVPSTAPILLNAENWAGVAASMDTVEDIPENYYGLRDANGDGLMDFFSGHSIQLGDGEKFVTATMSLPAIDTMIGGAYGNTEGATHCLELGVPHTYADTDSTLEDVTGDGVADYFTKDRLYVGTGSGFRPPMAISGLETISRTQTMCFDGDVLVEQGLYDLDGDGRPEHLNANGETWAVKYLQGSSGLRALSAGKLTAIENGHGERTEIVYEFAKDDNTTRHQTPAPEIVVGKVKTIRSGHTITETTYGYGNPLYSFDPLEQRFRSFGYGRVVSVTPTDSEARLPGVGKARATITDRNEFVLDKRSDTGRMLSTLRAGTVSKVTELAGQLPEAKGLLTTNVTSDSRRIGQAIHGYSASIVINGSSAPEPAGCLFADNPYAGTSGETYFSAINTCLARGFAFENTTKTWHGGGGPNWDDKMDVDSSVESIDGFGRVTSRYVANDDRLSSDDLCVRTTYAVPEPGLPRVLSAVSVAEIGVPGGANGNAAACDNSQARSVKLFEYDGLAPGKVSKGRVTREKAERRSTNGTLLDTITLADFTYDTRGRLTSMTSANSDGRTRQVTMSKSDDFDLVLTDAQVAATNAITQDRSVAIDAVTMLPVSVTDANGLVTSASYDGFQRPVMSLIKKPGENEGVLSYTQYFGFDGRDPVGRRVVEKRFDNPVSRASVATAVGHSTTTSLDESGRVVTRVADLGSDYSDNLVVSAIVYDELGRIAFRADPFPDSADATTAYGTTYFYNDDGTLKCEIRGSGVQAYSEVSDDAAERYPTCYRHWVYLGSEWFAVKQADALTAGSPQADVERRVKVSAIGQVREHQTWQGEDMLENSTFFYDSLGYLTTHRRMKLDVEWAYVDTTTVHDSFGRVIELRENETLTRTNTYSNWGELLETSTPADTATNAPARKEVMQYDGLGRLVHKEERNDNVVDGETVSSYSYDTGISIHSAQPATYTLGRLAKVASPTSETYFGYDVFGRLIAKATKDPQNAIYVETMTQDVGGALTQLGMIMPDTGSSLQSVNYQYDSAGRLKHARSSEGVYGMPLYDAEEIDPLGRVRSAKVGGEIDYSASYADTGRRLMTRLLLNAPDMGERRQIDLAKYDPIGRELQRTEQTNSSPAVTYTSTYDNLGRLLTAESSTGKSQTFSYDSLGNILSIDSSDANDRYFTYRGGNWDRLCVVSNLAPTDPTACNVTHDALGNIVGQPTASGGQRTLSFFGSGAVKQIQEGGATANFKYDAFGAVQELDINGNTSDHRSDRRYGLVEKRDTAEGSLLVRNFPVGNITASRRGDFDNWVFAIGDGRGNRFFASGNAFLQDATYDSYGKPTPTGVLPQSPYYSREQWNGGDFLATFTLSHLGARLYDPMIGRFLSPDPLVQVKTSSTSNPYAFAYNDPINFTDPTGLETKDGFSQGDSSTEGDFYEQNSGGGTNIDLGDLYEKARQRREREAAERWQRDFNDRWARNRLVKANAGDLPRFPPIVTPKEPLRTALPSSHRDGYYDDASPFSLNIDVIKLGDASTSLLADAGNDWPDIVEQTSGYVLKKIDEIPKGTSPEAWMSKEAMRAEKEAIRQVGQLKKVLGVVHGVVGFVDKVSDSAQALNAVGTLIHNPNADNAHAAIRTGIEIALMDVGPLGWFTKWYMGEPSQWVGRQAGQYFRGNSVDEDHEKGRGIFGWR